MSITKKHIPLEWVNNDRTKFESLKTLIIEIYERAERIAKGSNKDRIGQLLVFYTATARYKLDNSHDLLTIEVCDNLWELISQHHMNTIKEKHISFIRDLDDRKISSSSIYFKECLTQITNL